MRVWTNKQKKWRLYRNSKIYGWKQNHNNATNVFNDWDDNKSHAWPYHDMRINISKQHTKNIPMMTKNLCQFQNCPKIMDSYFWKTANIWAVIRKKSTSNSRLNLKLLLCISMVYTGFKVFKHDFYDNHTFLRFIPVSKIYDFGFKNGSSKLKYPQRPPLGLLCTPMWPA